MFRLWLFVISAFLLLIVAWSSLIFVAAKFSPQQISVNAEKPR
jgi:cell division septal protein FtsQ